MREKEEKRSKEGRGRGERKGRKEERKTERGREKEEDERGRKRGRERRGRKKKEGREGGGKEERRRGHRGEGKELKLCPWPQEAYIILLGLGITMLTCLSQGTLSSSSKPRNMKPFFLLGPEV